VVTWKDQSGNGNDATAAAPTNEPTIYTGGALVKENGKVALDFDGSDDYLKNAGNLAYSSGLSLYMTYNLDTNTGTGRIFCDDITGVQGYFILFDSGLTQLNDNDTGFKSFTASTSAGSQVLHSINFNGSTGGYGVAFDGNNTTGTLASWTGPINSTNTANIGIMASGNGAQFGDGKLQEIIAYPSDKSTDRTDIESNIGDYFTQNTPLLDTYSGAAAAYSLRLLDSTYTGALVEVYNGSSYADIYPNVFGELDTVALAAHCGSNDGFVSVWYDQSGNSNDAAQATTANMPKIYDGTTGVVTENGKPAIKPLAAQGMNTGLTLNDFSIVTAGNNGLGLNNNTTQCYMLSTYAGSGSIQPDEIILRYLSNYDLFQASNSVSVTSAIQPDNFVLFGKRDGTNLSLGFNGGTYSTTTCATTTTDVIYLMGAAGGSNIVTVQAMHEIIIYNSAQSDANRTNIEDNINTFYNIY
jgi:hypothetical protein